MCDSVKLNVFSTLSNCIYILRLKSTVRNYFYLWKKFAILYSNNNNYYYCSYQ